MNADTTTPEAIIADEPNNEIEQQPPLSFFRKWSPLIVMAIALGIIILDTTILNVSLRNIISDLHTNIQNIQWVITGYALVLAAFTITGGRLGDLFGRKRMFVAGAIIFAIGSFITSISPNVGIMILGEAIIEGIGACLMMPATSALLISNYKDRDRALAFGVWGGIAAASAALGPVIGGWLTTHYSWRWAFRINVVVVLILIAGSILIKESRDREEKPTLDIVGIILSSLGLLSLVYGFIEASTYGWLKVKEQLVVFHHTLDLGGMSVTPLFIILGIIILGIFVWWQNHVAKAGRTPLISLKLFRNRQFVVGSLVTAIISLGLAGLGFSIPVYFQGVRNMDALHTGIAMLPLALAILVAAPFSAYIGKYIKPKALIIGGLIINIIGYWVMYATLNVNASAWHLAPGFAIFGFGMGLMFGQLSNITLSAISVQEAGEASGVNNTFRQLGTTLGSAIMGAILLSVLGSQLVSGVTASSVIPDPAKAQISQTVSRESSSIEFGGDSGFTASSIPEFIKTEIIAISHQATVDANRAVLLAGMAFGVLGVLIAFGLPALKKPGSVTIGETQEEDGESIAESVEEANAISLKKAALISAALIIILAGTAGAIGYYAGKNKNDNEAKKAEILFPTIKDGPFQPNTGIPDPKDIPNINPTVPPAGSPETAAAIAPPVVPTAPTQTTVPIPASTPVPTATSTTTVSPTPVLTSQTYTNTQLQFRMVTPTNWQMKNNGDEVVLITPTKVRYSVQSYVVGNNTISNLQAYLDGQSNIHNTVMTSFNGQSAVRFDVDGFYQHGYAFLANGRLYYVMGNNLSEPVLQTIKAI